MKSKDYVTIAGAGFSSKITLRALCFSNAKVKYNSILGEMNYFLAPTSKSFKNMVFSSSGFREHSVF
jgi:hypothetical protein